MNKDKETKILAGITHSSELYTLKITTERDGKPYFSMCGETSEPIELEEAKNRVWEDLTDGEFWKMAVQDGRTELGKEEWAQQVIDIDGDLAGFDYDTHTGEIEVNGSKYLLEWRAFGQHEEETLKHYFIDEKLYRELMKLWNQYHLKELPKNSTAEDIYKWAKEVSEKQGKDTEYLVKQAVEIIISDNK